MSPAFAETLQLMDDIEQQTCRRTRSSLQISSGTRTSDADPNILHLTTNRVTGGWGDTSVHHPTDEQEFGSGQQGQGEKPPSQPKNNNCSFHERSAQFGSSIVNFFFEDCYL